MTAQELVLGLEIEVSMLSARGAEGKLCVVNCTPHNIVLNDGTIYVPSGVVPRVGVTFSEFIGGVSEQYFSEVVNLPSPVEGVLYIVSAMILSAVGNTREDLVAPATGHPQCVRKDGHIVSVPGFVR